MKEPVNNDSVKSEKTAQKPAKTSEEKPKRNKRQNKSKNLLATPTSPSTKWCKKRPRFCPTAKCAEFTFRQRRSRRFRLAFSDKAAINNRVPTDKIDPNKADIKVKEPDNKALRQVFAVRVWDKILQTLRNNFLQNRRNKRARTTARTVAIPIATNLTIAR